MKLEPSEWRAVRVMKLKEYFRSKPDGSRCSYVEIEQESGVDCSGQKGRALIRKSLLELSRPYMTLYGYGLELTTGDNCSDVAVSGVRKVLRSGRRLEKVCTKILTHHEKNISSEAKSHVLGAAGFVGALRTLSASAPKLIKR